MVRGREVEGRVGGAQGSGEWIVNLFVTGMLPLWTYLRNTCPGQPQDEEYEDNETEDNVKGVDFVNMLEEVEHVYQTILDNTVF